MKSFDRPLLSSNMTIKGYGIKAPDEKGRMAAAAVTTSLIVAQGVPLA
jgi:hypothetical protein